MPKPIRLGKNERQSFSKISEVAQMPNLIQIQTKSYDWFIKEGLKEIFEVTLPSFTSAVAAAVSVENGS